MAEAMPSSLRRFLWAGSAVLVLGGLLLFATAPEPERIGDVAAGLRGVATWRVEATPVGSRIELSAVLEARRSIELFSETRGPVTAVGAEELESVSAGQLLVQVDPLRAELEVEGAEATLARARSQLALARSNLERRNSLFEQGVVSDAELDDAANAERVAAAALRQARADRARAGDELVKKTIRAPFDGVLRAFPVEVGEFVQDGQSLAELLDLSRTRVTVGVSDREVVVLRAGQSARLRVQAYPDEVFEGSVLRVGSASDPETKKFPVEVELANEDRRLLPGMVARVELALGEPQLRTLVPREATLEEFGLRFVYVVDPDGDAWVARRRRVALRPLPFQPGDLELLSGVAVGEEIAVSAVGELRDGERVQRNGNLAH